jgi:hypothetical protein
MQAGKLHSGGQQTCLNAMLMAKPTIAVGRKWAVDFLRDGDNGLIVDYQDAAGLRRAVEWVLRNPDGARRMGERGRLDAARFTTQRTMESVYRLVKAAVPKPAPSASEGEEKPLAGARGWSRSWETTPHSLTRSERR